MKKSYAVLGLGRFGKAVALALSESGVDVLAVDSIEENVQDIVEEVTYAVQADISDADAMGALGLSNMDAVFICVGGSLEASVFATINAKELGVPMVIAKAMNETHEKILKKVGADMVIIPEREAGTRLAHKIVSGNFLEYVELSKDVNMIEIPIKKEWVGKNLIELDLRKKYKMNVIAMRDGEQIIAGLDPSAPFKENVSLFVIANERDMSKLS